MPPGIAGEISVFESFFLDAVFDLQLVQLAGTDAGNLRGAVDPPFAEYEQLFEVPAFKVLDDMPTQSCRMQI